MFVWNTVIVNTHTTVPCNRTETYLICKWLDPKDKGMPFYSRPEPDFKAILTNKKKQSGNRGSGSVQPRKWLHTQSRINKCRNREKSTSWELAVQKRMRWVKLISMVTGEDGTQAWLLLKSTILAFWELQGWPETQTPVHSYFCYNNTSKGQTVEELKVLLFISGTLFCVIVQHGLSFGQPCT